MKQKILSTALAQINSCIGDPRQGLPEEVFLFASSITPMVNVDLLVRNNEGHILLSWRDDRFSGRGWHVPGGVVRFKEPLIDRVQKTALNEFGCEVRLTSPIPEYIEFIREDGPPERSHFIAFVYNCRLPEGITNPPLKVAPGTVGHLAFHEFFPENMISFHYCYRKYF